MFCRAVDGARLARRGFSSFTLRPGIMRTLRGGKFRGYAPVRTLTLPLALTNHSMTKRTRANAKGAVTFLASAFRCLLSRPTVTSHGIGRPHTLVVTPAHRLTIRVRTSTRPLTRTANLGLNLTCNNSNCSGRLGILRDNISVLVNAAKHLVSCTGRGRVGLNTVRIIMLSRTSHVCSLNFVGSVH